MVLNTNDSLTLKLSSDSLRLSLSSQDELTLIPMLPKVVYGSLYDLAVKNGFIGTEAEWLESLRSTITIGSITNGNSISITNSGTSRDAVFDFVFPTNIESLGQEEVVFLNCGTATEVI